MATATDEETVRREQEEFEAEHDADATANGNGGGKSLEQQAQEGGDDAEDDGTHQLILTGTGTKLTGNVGGKRPNESYFKMSAVSLPIGGNLQANKDDELWIAVPVAIDKVEVKNRRKGGEIAAVVRTHTAIAIGQPIILDGPPETLGAPE